MQGTMLDIAKAELQFAKKLFAEGSLEFLQIAAFWTQ